MKLQNLDPGCFDSIFFNRKLRFQCLKSGLKKAGLFVQQALPVDLSSSGIRSHGSGAFHGTSAFDPCCPGSSSRTALYGHQAGAGPSQALAMDGYGSGMVAQPQPPPQASLSSCRHYMHSPCEYCCTDCPGSREHPARLHSS